MATEQLQSAARVYRLAAMSPMRTGIRFLARATLVALCLLTTGASLAAQATSDVVTYSEEQAERGEKVFSQV